MNYFAPVMLLNHLLLCSQIILVSVSLIRAGYHILTILNSHLTVDKLADLYCPHLGMFTVTIHNVNLSSAVQITSFHTFIGHRYDCLHNFYDSSCLYCEMHYGHIRYRINFTAQHYRINTLPHKLYIRAENTFVTHVLSMA